MKPQEIGTQLMRGNHYDFDIKVHTFAVVNREEDLGYPVSGDQLALVREYSRILERLSA